jgi:cytochrome c peroxidase
MESVSGVFVRRPTKRSTSSSTLMKGRFATPQEYAEALPSGKAASDRFARRPSATNDFGAGSTRAGVRSRTRLRDVGAFKTPTLRDVTRTAPYMHDGSLPTLDAVVDFYDRGGMANPQLDRMLQPLGLAAGERSAVLAFLGTLDGVIRGRW